MAAACCGGHAAIPSLITGDEIARFSSSVSVTQLVGDAPADGRAVFFDPSNQPTRTALNLSASYSFAPRWQVGAGMPIGIGSAVGDFQALVGYEAVPRPDNLSLAPKVILFTQFVAPSGRSPDDVQFIDEGQITGGGFYRLAAGGLALTTYEMWDFFALTKAAAGFARSFDDGNGGQKTIDPGWEGDATLGLGYAVSGEWRVGGSLTATANEGFRVRYANGQSETLSRSLWWPLEVQAAWFFSPDGVAALAYTDETVMGPAQNALLTRAASLQLSYRFGSR